MLSTSSLLGFALISLSLVLTPGPSMIYLISRSITPGPAAGIVSFGGVALGFAAGSIALFLAQRPAWMLLQRYLVGSVLAGLAVRMAFEARKA
jgi:threonine/homoserine/homoserine lactone efflux protein